MPIKIQNDLPAKHELEEENIFVMDESRALSQDFRELQIAILNLMPLKQDTELQLLRALSNTPLQIDVTFIQTESHISKNTSHSHIKKFYETFTDIKDKNFDGLIITGAPVEKLDFEEVNYWDELTKIMEWSKEHVTSTLHICWGAQAGLYYHYGLKKHLLDKKVFGVFEHHVMNRKVPLVRGFDDYFMAPHSRHTEVRAEDMMRQVCSLQSQTKADAFSSWDTRSMTVSHLTRSTNVIKKKDCRSISRSTIIRMMMIRKSRGWSGGHMGISSTQTG